MARLMLDSRKDGNVFELLRKRCNVLRKLRYRLQANRYGVAPRCNQSAGSQSDKNCDTPESDGASPGSTRTAKMQANGLREPKSVSVQGKKEFKVK